MPWRAAKQARECKLVMDVRKGIGILAMNDGRCTPGSGASGQAGVEEAALILSGGGMRMHQRLKLRSAFACIFVAWLSLAAGKGIAQEYPSRPIRLIVPYGPAGGPDLMARIVGRKLSDLAGQPVVIENRPGASGLIGTALGAKAANDGYTILVGDTGPLSIAPSVQKSLSYNPINDFSPISLGTTAPLFLAVNKSLPVGDIKELVAYLKTHPGLPYGSTGNLSVHHLGMELFFSMTGVQMNHIPYKTLTQSVPALLTSEVALLIAAYPTLRPHVTAGTIRLLAVATRARAPFAPTVPTVAESGVPGYEIKIDVGFLAPAGTPREIVNKLNGWIRRILAMPDVIQQLTDMGLIPVSTTPEEYAETIRADGEKFRTLIRAIGVKAE